MLSISNLTYRIGGRTILEDCSVNGMDGWRVGVPAVVTPIPAVTEIVSKYDVVAESFSSPALAAAMAKLLNAPPPPRFAMQFELERFDLQRVTQQIIKTYEDIFKNVSAGYSTGKDL